MGILNQELTVVTCSRNDFVGLSRTLKSLTSFHSDMPQVVLVLSEYSQVEINLINSEFAVLNPEIYQIDAFTDKIFGGNPACIVPLKEWLPDSILKNIAAENAVAETAFIIDCGNYFKLRWFTPEIEMDLCGHATLAAAHCIEEYQAGRWQEHRNVTGRLFLLMSGGK